jgi:hypothetical protein
MRSIVAISFVFLYLIALLRPLSPYLEYYSNRDFFAEVLCINKAKPELKCNGKCILMQKLKQATQQESDPISLPSLKFENYPIGFVEFLPSQQVLSFSQIKKQLFAPNVDYRFELISDLFRPPGLISITLS